jgi:hypothetical protein
MSRAEPTKGTEGRRPMARADYLTETRILREIAGNPRCRWVFTWHVQEHMALPDRAATQPDVKHALMNGHILLIETSKKDVLWRVVGIDLDDRNLTVVAAVFPDEIRIKIVTLWRS